MAAAWQRTQMVAAPNLAYVIGGGKSGSDLVVMDIGQRNVAWSVPLGNQPQGVVLSTDGRFAYVTEAGANRVAIVDTRERRVVGSMATGAGPQAIAVDPSGSLHWLFVANTVGNTVTVLDTDTQRCSALRLRSAMRRSVSPLLRQIAA